MDIQCIGEKSFKLTGKTASVAIFPEKSAKADIVIDRTSSRHEAKRVVSAPGEYEIAGISVFGFPFGYFISIDDIRVFYAVSSETAITDDEVEKVGEIDILIVPVGASIDEYVSKLSAAIVIPFGEVSTYIEKLGITAEKQPKLSVKAGSFLSDSTKTILLSRL